jgi:hypothetical protein
MAYGFSCGSWGAADVLVAGLASPPAGMRVNDATEQASTNNAVTGTDQKIELSLGAFIVPPDSSMNEILTLCATTSNRHRERQLSRMRFVVRRCYVAHGALHKWSVGYNYVHLSGDRFAQPLRKFLQRSNRANTLKVSGI